jgi:hypothetical protein
MLKQKLQPAVLVLISSLLLLSCHSEHLHSNYAIHHGAQVNQDSSQLAFFLSHSAYYPAKGISRFPDGGRSDVVFEQLDLYVYDIRDADLHSVMGFEDFVEITGNSRSSIKSNLLWQNDSLYFTIAPVSEWDFYLEHSDSDSKKAKIRHLETKYAGVFLYTDTDISTTDSSNLPPETDGSDVKLGDIRKTLETLPAEAIGINVRELSNRSDKQLIRECILAENKSPLTRRAIAEQIIIPKGNETIQDCIKKIEEHKRDLSGIDKTQYASRIAPVENSLRKALLQSGHSQ